MNSPLVSVIIPNYNHARFLDERIQSVLNQTYQNFELIILDDCSTDNSLEVINKYKDNPHVSHIVVNEGNSGSPFKQWHKGFELAKGEWIWIAESDDSCNLVFLKTLIRLVDDNTSFVFCRSKRIDEEGKLVKDKWQDHLHNSFSMDGIQFLRTYLGHKNIVWNASSVVFRKDFAYRIPKDYMDYSGAGDWLFWIRLSQKGFVKYASEPLNLFRLHGNNTTQRDISSGKELIEVSKIYHLLKEKNYISLEDYQVIRDKCIKSVYLYSTYSKDVVNQVLSLWQVSCSEKLLLLIKRYYIKIRNQE